MGFHFCYFTASRRATGALVQVHAIRTIAGPTTRVLISATSSATRQIAPITQILTRTTLASGDVRSPTDVALFALVPQRPPCCPHRPTRTRGARHARASRPRYPPRTTSWGDEGCGNGGIFAHRGSCGMRGGCGHAGGYVRWYVPPVCPRRWPSSAIRTGRLLHGQWVAIADDCGPLDTGMLYFIKYPFRASNARRNGVSMRAASFTIRDKVRVAARV